MHVKTREGGWGENETQELPYTYNGKAGKMVS